MAVSRALVVSAGTGSGDARRAGVRGLSCGSGAGDVAGDGDDVAVADGSGRRLQMEQHEEDAEMQKDGCFALRAIATSGADGAAAAVVKAGGAAVAASPGRQSQGHS